MRWCARMLMLLGHIANIIFERGAKQLRLLLRLSLTRRMETNNERINLTPHHLGDLLNFVAIKSTKL